MTPATRHRFILATVVFVALLIRIERAYHGSFWLDEALSWRLTEFDIGELFRRLAQDKHSPLYFLLLKAWIWVFGPSVLTIRMLSVVLGTVTAVAIDACVVAGAPTWSQRYSAGSMAALLIGISPFQVFASQLGRMYALATALTALSTWALFRALGRAKQPTGRRAWALYAAFACLLAYAHYFGVFVLIAQGIVVIRDLAEQAGGIRAFFRSRLWRYPVAVALVVAVAGLPWFTVFLGQAEQGGFLPPLTVGQWAGTLSSCLFQTQVAPVSSNMVLAGPVLYLQFGGCVVALLALMAAAKRGPRPLCHLATIALVPILFMTLVSILGPNVFVFRYLIIPQVAVLATLGVAIGLIRRRWLSVLVATGAALVLAWRAVAVLPQLPPFPDAARILAECVAARAGSEAPIVAGPFYYFPLRYVDRGDGRLFLFAKSGTIPGFIGANALTPCDQVTSFEGLSRWQRVIVVRDGIGSSNGLRVGPDAAPRGWRVIEERRVASSERAWVSVTTYETATD